MSDSHLQTRLGLSRCPSHRNSQPQKIGAPISPPCSWFLIFFFHPPSHLTPVYSRQGPYLLASLLISYFAFASTPLFSQVFSCKRPVWPRPGVPRPTAGGRRTVGSISASRLGHGSDRQNGEVVWMCLYVIYECLVSWCLCFLGVLFYFHDCINDYVIFGVFWIFPCGYV